jgi:hypothetical protein
MTKNMKKLACGPLLPYPRCWLLKPTCSSLSSMLPVEVNKSQQKGKVIAATNHCSLLLHFVLLLELTNWSKPGAQVSTYLAQFLQRWPRTIFFNFSLDFFNLSLNFFDFFIPHAPTPHGRAQPCLHRRSR